MRFFFQACQKLKHPSDFLNGQAFKIWLAIPSSKQGFIALVILYPVFFWFTMRVPVFYPIQRFGKHCFSNYEFKT